MKLKFGDTVRVLAYPEDHMNAYARVEYVQKDGKVLLANMNMPFQGTISFQHGHFDPKQLRLVRSSTSPGPLRRK